MAHRIFSIASIKLGILFRVLVSDCWTSSRPWMDSGKYYSYFDYERQLRDGMVVHSVMLGPFAIIVGVV